MTGTAVLWQPIHHVLRVVLEAVTPISLTSGEASGERDTVLLRDWNGLPCLSGTSLAGVLRAAYADCYGEDAASVLFGLEEHGTQVGQASRVMAGFGLALDSTGAASADYRPAACLAADPVLLLLSRTDPAVRDNVAITVQGVASDHLKFERTICPRGSRFAVDFALDGSAGNCAADAGLLSRIAQLFSLPYIRFGGAGRRGLGRLAIARDNDLPQAFQTAIDRRGKAGRAAWEEFRQSAPHQMNSANFRQLSGRDLAMPAVSTRRLAIAATLTLQPQSYWRIGQGVRAWSPTGSNENVQVAPPMEPVVTWTNGQGHVATENVSPIPGSSVKGALAHRAEFHLRRIRGEFGERDDGRRLMDALFGSVNDRNGGFAGALSIDDGIVGPMRPTTTRIRNSIDRHSGGVRMGVLFGDESFWRGDAIVLNMALTEAGHPRCVDDDAARALDWAIEDLLGGTLALGARGAGGDGTIECGQFECHVAGQSFPTFEAALKFARHLGETAA